MQESAPASGLEPLEALRAWSGEEETRLRAAWCVYRGVRKSIEYAACTLHARCMRGRGEEAHLVAIARLARS